MRSDLSVCLDTQRRVAAVVALDENKVVEDIVEDSCVL